MVKVKYKGVWLPYDQYRRQVAIDRELEEIDREIEEDEKTPEYEQWARG